MHPNDYILNAIRTESPYQPGFSLTEQGFRFAHAAIGICTEVGELRHWMSINAGELQAAATVTTDGQPGPVWEIPPGLMLNAREELGDVQWYVAIGTHTFGFDLASMDDHAALDYAHPPFPDYGTLDDIFEDLVIVSAELLNQAKRHVWYHKELDQTEVLRLLTQVNSETYWLGRTLGLDMPSIRETNIAKLRTRYPQKFTTDAAINRDLGAENKTLGG